MTGLISANGQISSLEEARISPLDRGFLFGDNVFEVMVGFGNKVLDFNDHMDRLRESASMLRLPIPWANEEINFEINNLVEQLATPKSYIRLVVTRGNGLGLQDNGQLQPNKYIYCIPTRTDPPQIYATGMTLKLCSKQTTKRGATAKTGNYIKSIIELHDAQQFGFDDILWKNAQGEITESSTANIFFIGRDGDSVEIATPPASSGLLLGITRKRVTQLLNSAQIPVTEKLIYFDELPRFDEAFLTSTVRGLIPITRISDQKYFTTRKNSVYNQVNRLYQAWVTSQLGHKINWADGSYLGPIER